MFSDKRVCERRLESISESLSRLLTKRGETLQGGVFGNPRQMSMFSYVYDEYAPLCMSSTMAKISVVSMGVHLRLIGDELWEEKTY